MRLVGHGYIRAADCDYGHGNDGGAHADVVSTRAHCGGRREGDQHSQAVGDQHISADRGSLNRTPIRWDCPDVGLR